MSTISKLARPLQMRGFSLVESVAASFILLMAIMLTFQLFHSGMQYFRWVEEKSLALNVADQRLAKIRNWARSQNGWSGFPSGPDPEHPEYNLSVTLANQKLASPCLELDSNFSQRREMTKTCKLITVKVAWSRGSVELYSLVADRSNRGWSNSNAVKIEGTIPALVTGTTSVSLSAKATDASNNDLDDVFFTWYVEPVGTTGALATITPSRDGRTATFINLTRRANGSTTPSTGQCRIALRAVYFGVEKWGYSPTINLAP